MLQEKKDYLGSNRIRQVLYEFTVYVGFDLSNKYIMAVIK